MDIITQVILPLILAFIMFSMGLSLIVDDFKRVAKFPKAFITGAALQIISLPVLAFFLTKFWVTTGNVEPAFAVGVIIVAACPGGVTSNLMTHLGRGDTALSISLTAVLSVVSVFTIPFIINFGHASFMEAGNSNALPVAKTIVGIFCITTLPVAIGMLINAKKPKLAARFEPKARALATVLFVLIILAAVIKKWAPLSTSFSSVGPIILTLNLLTMFLAFAVSKLLRLGREKSIAIIFECGLQNGTLAIMIAATFLKNELMMIPGGIYSLLMFFTGGLYLLYLMKKNQAKSTSHSN
jgi:BASS family bile acid:Na+ symporter